MRTLSANIAVELPEAAVHSTHYRALFSGAMVLFVMTFVLNTAAELLRQRLREVPDRLIPHEFPDHSKQRTHGEIQVWLTAAGLACGLLMIAGLLALILANGISVFWPKPLIEFTREGQGRHTREIQRGTGEDFQVRRTAKGEPKTELAFTGNKDAYGLGFRFSTVSPS